MLNSIIDLFPKVTHTDKEVEEWNKAELRREQREFALAAGLPWRVYRHYSNGLMETPAILQTRSSIEKNKKIIVLHGPPGTGKSCAAISILLDRLAGHYITSDKYCDLTKSYDGRDLRLLDVLKNTTMLVVDDAGIEETKDNGRIERLINYRYDAESTTIITTNLHPQDLKKHYKDRVASRIREVGEMIKCGDIIRPGNK